MDRGLHAPGDSLHLPQAANHPWLRRHPHNLRRPPGHQPSSRRDCPNPTGSYWGEVQGNIAKALGAVGAITDCGVRDLNEAEAIGVPFWAKEVLVSDAYVHPALVNEPVDVGGITVNPGDPLATDLHGVINVPIDAVDDIVKISELEAKREAYVIGLCQSGEEVTPDKLEEAFTKGNAVSERPGAAY